MRKLSPALIRVMSLALIAFVAGAAQPQSVPGSPLLSDITHVFIYWDERNRDELSKIGSKAQQQTLFLVAGIPIKITEDLFHKPVRLATSKVSVEQGKVLAMLQNLNEPFLKYGDWKAFRRFIEKRLLGIEDSYLEAQQGPIYDIYGQLAQKTKDSLQLTLRTRVFLDETHIDKDHSLPAETTTCLFLARAPKEIESRVRSSIESGLAPTVGVFAIKKIQFNHPFD